MNTESNIMSAMQLERARRFNATALYLQALAAGHKPADEELAQLCTALHRATVNADLMLWLDHSFDDQADSVYRAIECARVSASQLAYYTSRDQERARELQGAKA